LKSCQGKNRFTAKSPSSSRPFLFLQPFKKRLAKKRLRREKKGVGYLKEKKYLILEF
jgi:hypothetical protein